ncbi:MAG: Rpn family recombination-promoting nuclease/putative transposase, partial [Proteobacteria bacterium]|nr:Rpn family recombination-promoting nuclease/putative transposase [Pseudomonadota bacterium]
MSRTYDLLDPKNDAVFKMMLTRPGSKPALICLLNAALQPKVPIIDLEVINPNVPIEVIGDKGTILDIHAMLADGTRIDIEMQMRSYKYLGRRAAYYGARMTVDSLKMGGGYDAVADSNVLFFLAEDQFHHRPDDFHVCYALRQVDSGAEAMPQLRDQMKLHFFEIPKAVKKLRAGCFDASNPILGYWLGFFN